MDYMATLPSSPSSLSSSTPKSATTLSIYQRARLHGRERLIVHPLEWTDHHLELLQCSFEQPFRAPVPVFSDILKAKLEGEPNVYYVKRLNENDNGCEAYLIRLLASDNSIFFYNDGGLYFYFNKCPIKLHCNVFFNPLDNVDTAKGYVPSVAYIDCKRIGGLRFRKMECLLGRRMSIPTRAIFNLHLKKITPADHRRDPYIFALLLAIAFQQQWVLEERGTPKPCFLAQVITTDYKQNFVRLYAAHIPSSFLDMFNLPTWPPSLSQKPISIRHVGVPLKPYKTFRLRLLSLLLDPYNTYMSHIEPAEQCNTTP